MPAKYYCDFCKKEIKYKEDKYDILSTSYGAQWFKEEVCHDCYWKIRGFISNLTKPPEITTADLDWKDSK